MSEYQLRETEHYEEDEIDLIELLKTILREKILVLIITIFFTSLSIIYYFYKENKPANYGVTITFSDETSDKINQINGTYQNISFKIKEIINSSFQDLLIENNEKSPVLLSTDYEKIEEALELDYNSIKIIDLKNRSYQYFKKIKKDEIKNISNEIKKNVKIDENILNNIFMVEIENNIKKEELNINNLKNEVEKLNKEISSVIKSNFNNISKEDLNSNLMIISPTLYIKYKERVNSLNNSYLILSNLKEVQKNYDNFIKFSGENKISIIKITSSNNEGFNNKLIILAGIILGLGAGMFIAIVKAPFKKMIKELN